MKEAMSALLVLVTADWTDERTYSAEALEEEEAWDWRVLEAYDGDLSLPRMFILALFSLGGAVFPKHLLFTLIRGFNMHGLKGRH